MSSFYHDCDCPSTFRYQAYELIHARWAMLGAAGFIIPEAFNKFGANCGPEAVWFKVCDLTNVMNKHSQLVVTFIAKSADRRSSPRWEHSELLWEEHPDQPHHCSNR